MSGRLSGDEQPAPPLPSAPPLVAESKLPASLSPAPATVKKATVPDAKIDALITQGKAHCTNNEYERAITNFDLVLSHRPKHAIAFYERSRAHAKTGNEKKALTDLNRAIELYPGIRTRYAAAAVIFPMPASIGRPSKMPGAPYGPIRPQPADMRNAGVYDSIWGATPKKAPLHEPTTFVRP